MREMRSARIRLDVHKRNAEMSLSVRWRAEVVVMPVSEPTVHAILTLSHIQVGPDERAHEWVRIVLSEPSMLMLVHLGEH
jgi:hypothetical protein